MSGGGTITASTVAYTGGGRSETRPVRPRGAPYVTITLRLEDEARVTFFAESEEDYRRLLDWLSADPERLDVVLAALARRRDA